MGFAHEVKPVSDMQLILIEDTNGGGVRKNKSL
jgi:hypothetical protein